MITTIKPKPLSEAHDIKNVDFRNLLTVVMGTISNQTGESFDKATLRAKSADEILRRFNEVTLQRNKLQCDHAALLAENKRLKETLDATLRSRDRLIDQLPGEYHSIAKVEGGK